MIKNITKIISKKTSVEHNASTTMYVNQENLKKNLSVSKETKIIKKEFPLKKLFKNFKRGVEKVCGMMKKTVSKLTRANVCLDIIEKEAMRLPGLYRKNSSSRKRDEVMKDGSIEAIEGTKLHPHLTGFVMKGLIRKMKKKLIPSRVVDSMIDVMKASSSPDEVSKTQLAKLQVCLDSIESSPKKDFLLRLLGHLKRVSVTEGNSMNANSLAICFNPSLFPTTCPQTNKKSQLLLEVLISGHTINDTYSSRYRIVGPLVDVSDSGGDVIEISDTNNRVSLKVFRKRKVPKVDPMRLWRLYLIAQRSRKKKDISVSSLGYHKGLIKKTLTCLM